MLKKAVKKSIFSNEQFLIIIMVLNQILGICGASLANTNDTDVTAIDSVAVVLVILLLKFQCSVTLGPFSVTKSVQYLHQHLTFLNKIERS
jgi:hypothetical protein